MDKEKTLYDRFLSRIKNNTFLSILLVLGTVIMSVAAFSDSVRKISDFLNKEETANIAGNWQTPPITNVYNKNDHFMLGFDFIQQGDKILGTVADMNTEGHVNAHRNLIDGGIKADQVTFYTQGGEAGVFKISYFGRLNKNKDEIDFTRVNNLPTGGEPETFVAKRKQP